MSAEQQPPTCIIGPQTCDKTSLLFQHAITYAEQGRSVLFISPSRIEQLPLLSSDQELPHSSILDRILFKYPATLSILQELFDGIHEARSPRAQLAVPGCHGENKGIYDCVILDEFHKYFVSMLQIFFLWSALSIFHPHQCKSHEQIATVARMCAHVVDAVQFLSSQMNGKSCHCLLSMEEPSPIPGLKVDLVQRWFPTVFKISSAGEDCSYSVSHLDSKGQEEPKASYTIHQTHFEWHQKLKLF